mgnify:CR=1 FL=1
MEDLQRAFSEFKNQVEEIAEHADSVQKLSFKAELKNGTAFRFNYNADSFGPKQAYHPNSVFNGIVDCVSALIAIWLLLKTEEKSICLPCKEAARPSQAGCGR